MKLVHAINALLLLALIGLSLHVYPDLPDRIPLHFGVDGTPDRWGRRMMLSWMILPLAGAAAVLSLYGVASFIAGRPHAFNGPNRKKLLELPQALQARVMRGASDMMYVTSLVLLVMFNFMQYGAWQSAHSGAGSRAMVIGAFFGLVAVPFVAIGWLIVMQRRLARAWREHQAAERDGHPDRAGADRS